MSTAVLSDLFQYTNGDVKMLNVPLNDNPSFLDAESAFMQNFVTPFTGTDVDGIMNPDISALPTIDDSYRDISNSNDFRLGTGLGVSRAFRKPDSMLAHEGDSPMFGAIQPNKNFGRSSVSQDLNNLRVDHTERAAMSFKKLGYKNAEQPDQAYYQPYEWNPQPGGPSRVEAATGDGNQRGSSAYSAFVRSHHPTMDADQFARRSYQPAPSRLTKMLGVDVEQQGLMQQRTLLDPLTYVTNDRQREKFQNISRNTDVTEAVIYENIMPRGMAPPMGIQAPQVYSEYDVLRQPIGTNDTGSRAVFDRLTNPYSNQGHEMLAETLEDNLVRYKADYEFVQGKNLRAEIEDFMAGERAFAAQTTRDQILRPEFGNYTGRMDGISGPVPQNASWPR